MSMIPVGSERVDEDPATRTQQSRWLAVSEYGLAALSHDDGKVVELLWEINGVTVANLDVERHLPVYLANAHSDDTVIVHVKLYELALDL
jgi:hypothetical protein